MTEHESLQNAIANLLDTIGIIYSVTDASRVWRRNGRVGRSKVRPGWPDMSLVIPPNGHAAFFEIKTPHDVLRTRQDEVISALLDSGASTCIPRCLDDAIAALVDWLEPGTKPYDKLHRLTFHNGTASQIADSSALQPAGGVETGKRHHGKTRKD